MISKNQISYISSLKIKKYREQHNQFIAEGVKIVNELLYVDSYLRNHWQIDSIYATKVWIDNNPDISKEYAVTEVTATELKKISSLKTPNEVLAIVNIPEISIQRSSFKLQASGICLMLDNISDPGNFGTIIRIADWFGINDIICSNDCVDVYNPKVIQATMGSFIRVNVSYDDLDSFLADVCHAERSRSTQSLNIYGALLNGDNIYNKQLSDKGIIIIGNESKGISEKIIKYINQPISIPYYTNISNTNKAESLNASIATGIICAEFRRQNTVSNLQNSNTLKK